MFFSGSLLRCTLSFTILSQGGAVSHSGKEGFSHFDFSPEEYYIGTYTRTKSRINSVSTTFHHMVKTVKT